MSLFCIIGYDAIGSNTKRKRLEEAHIIYLQGLKQQNQLFAAGPLMDAERVNACGSMLIVDFATQTAVENWFAKEPFNQANVYEKIQIHPYIDGMPFV